MYNKISPTMNTDVSSPPTPYFPFNNDSFTLEEPSFMQPLLQYGLYESLLHETSLKQFMILCEKCRGDCCWRLTLRIQ